MTLHVTKISYSKNCIDDYFDNGKSLVNLCRDYLCGNVNLFSLAQIKVVYQDGNYIVKNGNRLLFVLKMLYKKGALGVEIPVKIISTDRKLGLVTDGMLRYNKKMEKDIKTCIRDHQREESFLGAPDKVDVDDDDDDDDDIIIFDDDDDNGGGGDGFRGAL